MQLKWEHQFQLAGYYTAKEKGYYQEYVFDKEIKRLRREHGIMSFLMLDIDHFKLYNDKYGHLKGMKCLLLYRHV